MAQDSEARFRRRLAVGFLEEAKQDLELERWRSCVDNSQLATENAAKAALALLGPVGARTSPLSFFETRLAKSDPRGRSGSTC